MTTPSYNAVAAGEWEMGSIQDTQNTTTTTNTTNDATNPQDNNNDVEIEGGDTPTSDQPMIPNHDDIEAVSDDPEDGAEVRHGRRCHWYHSRTRRQRRACCVCFGACVTLIVWWIACGITLAVASRSIMGNVGVLKVGDVCTTPIRGHLTVNVNGNVVWFPLWIAGLTVQLDVEGHPSPVVMVKVDTAVIGPLTDSITLSYNIDVPDEGAVAAVVQTAVDGKTLPWTVQVSASVWGIGLWFPVRVSRSSQDSEPHGEKPDDDPNDDAGWSISPHLVKVEEAGGALQLHVRGRLVFPESVVEMDLPELSIAVLYETAPLVIINASSALHPDENTFSVTTTVPRSAVLGWQRLFGWITQDVARGAVPGTDDFVTLRGQVPTAPPSQCFMQRVANLISIKVPLHQSPIEHCSTVTSPPAPPPSGKKIVERPRVELESLELSGGAADRLEWSFRFKVFWPGVRLVSTVDRIPLSMHLLDLSSKCDLHRVLPVVNASVLNLNIDGEKARTYGYEMVLKFDMHVLNQEVFNHRVLGALFGNTDMDDSWDSLRLTLGNKDDSSVLPALLAAVPPVEMSLDALRVREGVLGLLLPWVDYDGSNIWGEKAIVVRATHGIPASVFLVLFIDIPHVSLGPDKVAGMLWFGGEVVAGFDADIRVHLIYYVESIVWVKANVPFLTALLLGRNPTVLINGTTQGYNWGFPYKLQGPSFITRVNLETPMGGCVGLGQVEVVNEHHPVDICVESLIVPLHLPNGTTCSFRSTGRVCAPQGGDKTVIHLTTHVPCPWASVLPDFTLGSGSSMTLSAQRVNNVTIPLDGVNAKTRVATC